MSGSAEHWKAWGQHIAIAAAYAACFEITFHLSSSHWMLGAGLRLGCLVLVPMRYWPALAVGEFFPLFENAVLCDSKFGAAWALAASVPPIVLCMASLKPMRQRWTLRAPDGTIRMGFLLTATLCCALTNAVRDTSAVLVILTSSSTDWGPGVSLSIAFSAYLLGAYLGALTLTPTILALYEQWLAQPLSIGAIGRSPLFRDCIAWVFPSLAALAWCAQATPDELLIQTTRLAMILPVLGMAWRHGWHGTAIAGMAASIAMAATSQAVRDPAVIQCQIALAFVLSASLFLHGKVKPSTATLFSKIR